MYIKSIVLDGFKSYGNRVEITGFDPEFNAITGLNGTGKSNILDSICFVLGITNLSNVRAGSLQELIYKHGQAGITKATVSISFDNRDKRQCPIGYENQDEITVTRQVVMGGKNKYLINGINVQNKRVSDLFCSVQLNVNNPHFLIMQGRITKVLNMKPAEILSMVEEAAGTRMYEAKKQIALKTIDKKDAKLRELNDIIREDIAPKLQKLQDERAQFQEYQKVVRELENLTRLYVAYRYVTAEQNAQEAEGKVMQVQNEIKSKKDNIKKNKKEAEDLDKEMTELSRRLDEESGNALQRLQAELQALERDEAGAGAAHRAGRDARAEHERRARLLQRALADDDAALAAKRAALAQISSTFENLRAASEASETALAEAQQKFLSVSSGNEGASESLQDQLMAAKAEASEASTRISQSTMEKKHAEERLKTLEKEFNSSSAQFKRDQDNIGKQQAQIDKLQAELSRMTFSAERQGELQRVVRAQGGGGACAARPPRRARRAPHALRVQVPAAAARLRQPQGQRLIDVCDPVYCTALETAAGGRLYNVVVDTEVTSKLLLQRGQLQTRTTIIPLNKISGHVIDRETVKLAQKIGGGPENVQLALDLISFAPHLRPAMAWVFGGTLVCRDLDTAKRVTFHPAVRRRCVTLDGDVFDPSGTLSGGARQKGGSVLLQLQELKQLEQTLQATEAQLSQDTAELNAMQQAAEKYTSTQQKYEMMSHELEVIKARLATTSTAQLHAEIQSLRAQVEELTAAVERDKVTQKETAARARELEAKVKDIKGHREREFKKAEEALKKAKKDAELHGNSWKQREQELETLKLEVQELENAVTTSRQQLEETSQAAEQLRETFEAAKLEHERTTEAVKEMQSRIKKQKAEISGRSGEITRLNQKKEQLGRASGDLELGIKELEYKIKELQTEAAECVRKIESLESEYTWIASEREYFGAAGGLYDFAGRQAHVAGQRLAMLKERRDKLARGLNARAHTLLGKEEEQVRVSCVPQGSTAERDASASPCSRSGGTSWRAASTRARTPCWARRRSRCVCRVYRRAPRQSGTPAPRHAQGAEGQAGARPQRARAHPAGQGGGAGACVVCTAGLQGRAGRQRLAMLKERRDKLARGLNARAHTLLGKEEEQVRVSCVPQGSTAERDASASPCSRSGGTSWRAASTRARTPCWARRRSRCVCRVYRRAPRQSGTPAPRHAQGAEGQAGARPQRARAHPAGQGGGAGACVVCTAGLHGRAGRQRLAMLKERRDKLARGLNARAHTLLGKEEEQVRVSCVPQGSTAERDASASPCSRSGGTSWRAASTRARTPCWARRRSRCVCRVYRRAPRQSGTPAPRHAQGAEGQAGARPQRARAHPAGQGGGAGACVVCTAGLHGRAGRQRLAMLKERRDKLARGLNARAHTLLGKEEEQVRVSCVPQGSTAERDASASPCSRSGGTSWRAASTRARTPCWARRRSRCVCRVYRRAPRQSGTPAPRHAQGAEGQAGARPQRARAHPAGQGGGAGACGACTAGLHGRSRWGWGVECYQDVMRKKAIVEADRAKLVQVMAELDEKKKQTLVTACEQVNRDFGSIFSTLLPGAQAKLKPPDGLTVLDGLEVKVGFNHTWKDSLGELSGGQRSLVALSLVLAMLLFKPAPLYILDEVDAALDLSHTQNIGQMLKEHFRHSQFIIVSLKDGMFNNANVLFRTRFVDGMSAVQRTVNSRR
ncbi:unnamed protein product [Arctia plantaginis]|uniref:Structural maintenance of chromosomes protein 2 n=2 Tax=Arctia plantaginis TaxID=874455 RepID=A0A8S0YLE6_ARCPL|nr:unnamed protein product [Arctia plantaginis]